MSRLVADCDGKLVVDCDGNWVMSCITTVLDSWAIVTAPFDIGDWVTVDIVFTGLVVCGNLDAPGPGDLPIKGWCLTTGDARPGKGYITGILWSTDGGEIEGFPGYGPLSARFSFIEPPVNSLDGNWHIMSLIKTGNVSFDVYLDGVLRGGSFYADAYIPSGGSFYIGTAAPGIGGGPLGGMLNGLRFSSVSRDPTTYGWNPASFCLTSDVNTLALWKFQDGTAATICIDSAGANNGSLQGSEIEAPDNTPCQ